MLAIGKHVIILCTTNKNKTLHIKLWHSAFTQDFYFIIIKKETTLNLFRQVFLGMHEKEIIGKIIWLSNSKTSLKESVSFSYSQFQTRK